MPECRKNHLYHPKKRHGYWVALCGRREVSKREGTGKPRCLNCVHAFMRKIMPITEHTDA